MTEGQFEKLARLISESHEELKSDIASLDAKIDTVRTELKADIAEVRTELRDFRAEVRDELADIRTELTSMKGFTKELDHAFERIARIKKHLGLVTA